MKNHRAVYLILFLISTGIIITPFFFRDFLQQIQTLGLFGIFLISFFSSATLFLPTPGIIAVAVGGTIYNPLMVALAASVGASLGEGVGFLFGFSSHQVIRFDRHKVLFHMMKYAFERYGVIFIFLFSLIPNPLFDGLGILAGLSRYSPTRFLIVVFAGRLVRNLIVAYAGSFF